MGNTEKPRKNEAAGPEAGPESDPFDRIRYDNGSIHDAIQRQVSELLANADISEEERQQILIAMSCPCCGAGGLSLSVELKPGRDKPPSF